jgi:hypothetical protein
MSEKFNFNKSIKEKEMKIMSYYRRNMSKQVMTIEKPIKKRKLTQKHIAKHLEGGAEEHNKEYNNEKDKSEGKYHLDLSFNGYTYDTEIKNFYRVIESIDTFIVNFIDNYQDCLGITTKGNYKYNHQIRYNKNNQKYPPTIKLKIFENTTKVVDLYDKEVNNFCEYIKPNAKIQALIRCNGLWSYENKWGLSWKVCKISVNNPNPNNFIDYSFIDDTDTEQ